MTQKETLVGKTGVVTGDIGPDKLGEVFVNVRGATEHFCARSSDPSVSIQTGAEVEVVRSLPGRTLIVRPLPQ